METHSKALEDTTMWKTYLTRLSKGDSRSTWVHQVYDSSITYLKDVRLRFQNYTLHDETHVLNVLDAMAGILGDQISKLTAGEAELLVLAACLHDLGMVYTEDEAKQCFANKKYTRDFLRTSCPELMGCPAEDWPDGIRQWYLRSLHPFRLPEVLQKEAWKELFSVRPTEIVSKQCIIAVCQAHGEDPEEFSKSRDMEYLPASDVDPLFCALLLRLADLLDFDDTRAPKVLYSYVAYNDQSRAEWKKHQSSGGFRFPDTPSTARLPYKARCTNPGIEHTIRDFLDWIDSELNVCMKLQRKCYRDWQRSFPFPQAISQEEIESEGYVSGDFQMTMDQARVMDLLTGEQLYDRNDVFIRELLQNSIDATLLRVEMDRDFSLQDARIDLWEWNDKDGNIWFRIDDQGTGMTQGMLQRYFLKIGNSYYTSRELKRDLRDHGQTGDYQAISRFGIGFLSCFLCGTFAEVSTLYFDSKKNLEESGFLPSRRTPDYGLRLRVTGLTGYYTLKSQAKQHLVDEPMPAPDDYEGKALPDLEQDGYRARPGTSIAIKLDPGRLGTVNLHERVEEYLCCAKVPVYYNGERIGRTYEEAMLAIHNVEGKRVYELTPELREKFDKCFPHCSGQYPKVSVTVVPLDTEKNQMLPNLSGAFVKYDVWFEETPCWEEKGRHYQIDATVATVAEGGSLRCYTENIDFDDHYLNWDVFIKGHPRQEVNALEMALEKLTCVPASADELGEAWLPFSSEEVLPAAVWKTWADRVQDHALFITFDELGISAVDIHAKGRGHSPLICSYRGIISGNIFIYNYRHVISSVYCLLLLLDGELRPTVKANRSGISNMPLELMVAIYGMLTAWEADEQDSLDILDRSIPQLSAWRKLRGTKLERWLKDNLQDHFEHILEQFSQPIVSWEEDSFYIGDSGRDNDHTLQRFLMASIQDTYQMTVNYEEGQIITFCGEISNEDAKLYDLFPPMMFCSAATQLSRRFLCSEDSYLRRCITADHPYAVWLLKSAVALNRYYARQFQQIVNTLRSSNSKYVIDTCNSVREQLLSLPERHGIDMTACPQLSEADFWAPKDETMGVSDEGSS